MGKIISISGRKGGCGNSTTSILLASTLAYKYHRNVLVIDMDGYQCSIANLRKYEIEKIESAKTKNSSSKENESFYNAYLEKDFVTYPIEQIIPDSNNTFDKIVFFKDEYDFIIVDHSKHMDEKSYLELAKNFDVVFVPLQLDDVSFDSNFELSKLIYSNLLCEDSNLEHLFLYWKNSIDIDQSEELDEIEKKEEKIKEANVILSMIDAEILENRMEYFRSINNNLCVSTMFAPKYGSDKKLKAIIEEMCDKLI